MIMKAFRRLGARRDEGGSALVELALSLPMLCLILLGAAEFARVAYASIEVANAAHAAAIYAASRAGAASDFTTSGSSPVTYSGGIVNAANADAHITCGGSPISVTNVSASCACTNAAATAVSCSDNQTCFTANSGIVTTMTVTTSCKFYPLISTKVQPGAVLGVSGVNGPFTLSGRSIQVVSNQQ